MRKEPGSTEKATQLELLVNQPLRHYSVEIKADGRFKVKNVKYTKIV